jgi:hypothetical protein
VQIQRAAISHTLRFRLSGPWRLATMGWPRDDLRARPVARGAEEQDGLFVAIDSALRHQGIELVELRATRSTLSAAA